MDQLTNLYRNRAIQLQNKVRLLEQLLSEKEDKEPNVYRQSEASAAIQQPWRVAAGQEASMSEKQMSELQARFEKELKKETLLRKAQEEKNLAAMPPEMRKEYLKGAEKITDEMVRDQALKAVVFKHPELSDVLPEEDYVRLAGSLTSPLVVSQRGTFYEHQPNLSSEALEGLAAAQEAGQGPTEDGGNRVGFQIVTPAHKSFKDAGSWEKFVTKTIEASKDPENIKSAIAMGIPVGIARKGGQLLLKPVVGAIERAGAKTAAKAVSALPDVALGTALVAGTGMDIAQERERAAKGLSTTTGQETLGRLVPSLAYGALGFAAGQGVFGTVGAAGRARVPSAMLPSARGEMSLKPEPARAAGPKLPETKFEVPKQEPFAPNMEPMTDVKPRVRMVRGKYGEITFELVGERGQVQVPGGQRISGRPEGINLRGMEGRRPSEPKPSLPLPSETPVPKAHQTKASIVSDIVKMITNPLEFSLEKIRAERMSPKPIEVGAELGANKPFIVTSPGLPGAAITPAGGRLPNVQKPLSVPSAAEFSVKPTTEPPSAGRVAGTVMGIPGAIAAAEAPVTPRGLPPVAAEVSRMPAWAETAPKIVVEPGVSGRASTRPSGVSVSGEVPAARTPTRLSAMDLVLPKQMADTVKQAQKAQEASKEAQKAPETTQETDATKATETAKEAEDAAKETEKAAEDTVQKATERAEETTQRKTEDISKETTSSTVSALATSLSTAATSVVNTFNQWGQSRINYPPNKPPMVPQRRGDEGGKGGVPGIPSDKGGMGLGGKGAQEKLGIDLTADSWGGKYSRYLRIAPS
jgi:chemotaxis protein histidine kinase CheA